MAELKLILSAAPAVSVLRKTHGLTPLCVSGTGTSLSSLVIVRQLIKAHELCENLRTQRTKSTSD